MLRTRTTAALAATLFGSTLLAAPALGSDEGPLSASLDPAQGPVGTSITISGDGCFVDDRPGWVNWGVDQTVDGKLYGIGYTPSGGNQADADGTWSWSFEVPAKLGAADGESLAVEPGAELVVQAYCHGQSEEAEDWLRYPEMILTVTASPPTTTTTSTAPTTTAPPATTPPAATPIVDDPPYNG